MCACVNVTEIDEVHMSCRTVCLCSHTPAGEGGCLAGWCRWSPPPSSPRSSPTGWSPGCTPESEEREESSWCDCKTHRILHWHLLQFKCQAHSLHPQISANTFLKSRVPSCELLKHISGRQNQLKKTTEAACITKPTVAISWNNTKAIQSDSKIYTLAVFACNMQQTAVSDPWK